MQEQRQWIKKVPNLFRIRDRKDYVLVSSRGRFVEQSRDAGCAQSDGSSGLVLACHDNQYLPTHSTGLYHLSTGILNILLKQSHWTGKLTIDQKAGKIEGMPEKNIYPSLRNRYMD